MSKTAKALLLKSLMNFVFAAAAFAFIIGNPLDWILIMALAVTVINYLVGDILILPSFGNTIAAAGDGLMAALIAHITGVVVIAFRTTLPAIIFFAVLVTIGEYFFHRYLLSSPKLAGK